MIEKYTHRTLCKIVKNPEEYSSGAKRKQLQSTYDKMLDEVSNTLFKEPCTSKMVLRQKINAIPNKTSIINVLIELIKNDNLLFSKDYRDHETDIERFLENHLKHFLEAVSSG